jgi:hypothetical protein
MKSLTIILATRGRPGLLAQTLDQTLKNVCSSYTELVVACDADDEQSITMARAFEPHIYLSVENREDTLGAKYNRALAPQHRAFAYLAMVDYAPHLTKGFDLAILDAAREFPDGIGVVFNRMANLSFPGINAITHNLAEKLGFIFPPYFPYWFIDHWIDDIARMIDRFTYAEVEVDVTRRPGTQELREPGFWGTFYDAAAVLRRKQAFDIIRSLEFKTPEWMKEILLRRHPLIEQRGEMINETLRQHGDQIALKDDGGQRYARVKAQAMTMLRQFVTEMEQERRQLLAAE